MRTPRGKSTGRRREDPLVVLQRAFQFLGSGELEAARAQAERALKLDPDLTEARGCLAEIALAAGDEEEACDQLRLALETDPDSPDTLFALGELLAHEDPEEAIELASHAEKVIGEWLEEFGPEPAPAAEGLDGAAAPAEKSDEDEEREEAAHELRHLLVDVVLLLTRCQLDLEREQPARAALDRLDPQVSWLLAHADHEEGRRAVLELAGARHTIGDLDRSAELCRALITRLEAAAARAEQKASAAPGAAPDHGHEHGPDHDHGEHAGHDHDHDHEDEEACPGCLSDAYYGLGLILQEQQKPAEALELLARVADLDRQEPRPAHGLTPQRFEEVAAAALGELPPVLAEKIGHVPVVVADYPSTALIADGLDPRLLGFFAGTPYQDQGSISLPRPTCIYLFQRNIERGCESSEEVEQEIRTTVLHEAGHYFGLSEEDLDERGLA